VEEGVSPQLKGLSSKDFSIVEGRCRSRKSWDRILIGRGKADAGGRILFYGRMIGLRQCKQGALQQLLSFSIANNSV
jgi:hypothetical protein